MRLSGFLLVIALLLFPELASGQAHRIRKMERQATNRTRLTLVRGDTVINLSIWLRHPRPDPDRTYYWYSQEYVRHTMGDYTGQLLHGAYRLLDREQHLLVSGSFKKGVRTGLWRVWRPNGILASSSQWRKGRQRGDVRLYDLSGKLIKPAKVRKSARKSNSLADFWHRILPKKRHSTTSESVQTLTSPSPELTPPPTGDPAQPATTKAAKSPKKRKAKKEKKVKEQKKSTQQDGPPSEKLSDQ